MLCGTFIPMVQATESRVSNNPTRSCGTKSASGRLLSQSQMRAILVIVAKVICKKSFQVSLVHGKDVIEQITTAASHPALGHSILPRALDRGLHASDLQGANRSQYFQAVFLVVIEEKELRG